jgi:hypothetical protein
VTLELLSLLGGGAAGFIFRFIAAQQEAAARNMEWLLKAQVVADDSADRASKRGTIVGRRLLLGAIIWVVAAGPFIAALFSIPTFVETQRSDWDILGWFTGGFQQLQGLVVLDEMRSALIAAVGFYLGSSVVGSKR